MVATVQLLPFRVKLLGTPLVPAVELPLRPKLTLPPAAMVLLQEAGSVAVTVLPDWVS
jgi:hypothetical protein